MGRIGNISAIIGLILAIISLGGNITTGLEVFGSDRAEKTETRRCLVEIAREETDMNVFYWDKYHLEVRSTNDKQGHYLFQAEIIKEVHYDKIAKDFFYQKGNARTFLKHESH